MICASTNNVQNEESTVLLDLEGSNEVESSLGSAGDHIASSKAMSCAGIASKARKVK